jgi:hypothetical protein
MDMLRRAVEILTGLVIAVVFGCALVHVLAMLAVYGVLLIQGEPMAINPGVIAGAMLIGAMQGANSLLVAVPLGAVFHFALKYKGWIGLVAYLGAGLVVAAAAALVSGFASGFEFKVAETIMVAASGLLGGFLFWMTRSSDRFG